jgi:hypothetical protein
LALNDLKDDIESLLAEAGTTYDHLPETFSPPAIIVREAPNGNYLTQGSGTRFGEFLVTYVALLVVKAGTNKVMVESLNNLLDGVLAALKDSDWSIGPVGSFSLETFNGNQYLVVSLELLNTYRNGG